MKHAKKQRTPPTDAASRPDERTENLVGGETLGGEEGPQVPADWMKGQLLNVRNTGTAYAVTLLGEEHDPRSPDRTLWFTNPATCQDFVSAWYARESYDPRA